MINPEILQFVTGICVSDVQIVPNPSCIRRILSCEPLRFRQFFHHAVFLPFDVLICGCDKTRRSGFPPARHVLRARRSDRNREFQCQERLHCVPCSVVHVPVMATRPCYITIDIGLRYAFYARITVFCAQIGKITQGRRRCRQREWEGLQTRRVTAGWKSAPIPRRTRHGENRARPPRDGFGIRHVAGPGHTAGSKTRVRATSPSPPPSLLPLPPGHKTGRSTAMPGWGLTAAFSSSCMTTAPHRPLIPGHAIPIRLIPGELPIEPDESVTGVDG